MALCPFHHGQPLELTVCHMGLVYRRSGLEASYTCSFLQVSGLYGMSHMACVYLLKKTMTIALQS